MDYHSLVPEKSNQEASWLQQELINLHFTIKWVYFFSSLTRLSPCNFRSMQWMLILHVHYYYYFGAPAGWCDWIKLFYHDAWILITWLKKIGYMDRQPYKLTWEHGKSGWAKTPVELGNERILFKFWIYICIFSRIWYMLFE